MPSEKKNKKHKGDPKAATSDDQSKPLSHYVSDRLELTKQLFSCLKNKQIKQRLPPNLQNKSIERIQQICLDEILGISSKRLVSIINNTRCPENTDSEDSEVEQVDEHISLEEISSDSEEEAVKKKGKETAEKKSEVTSKKPKTAKEMTMLELLELQARARAIRSQLALEPVTKIELNSDDEGGEENHEESSNNVAGPSSKSATNDKNKVKNPIPAKKPETVTKAPEPTVQQLVIRRAPPPPPAAPKPVQSAKPLKLKRNYKSQASENSNSSTLISKKEPSPPKADESKKNGNDEDDRCSSPDVINMDPSPETFFISDSEDDEPPTKKTPERKEITSVDVKTTEKIDTAEPQQPEEGELSDASSREESLENELVKEEKAAHAPAPEDANDNAMNDDDVVHLMSDTEIELHHQSDKEDDEGEEEAVVKPQEKPVESSTVTEEKTIGPNVEQQANFMSDDDVVEIHNSSDDEMMNESDDKSAGETAKSSQTWEQRWLSSSKTQNILKTTQLASKVRVNMLKTKKSQKASDLESEQKKVEGEKAIKEKVSSLEEGSMKQFKTIKESSNSSNN